MGFEQCSPLGPGEKCVRQIKDGSVRRGTCERRVLRLFRGASASAATACCCTVVNPSSSYPFPLSYSLSLSPRLSDREKETPN